MGLQTFVTEQKFFSTLRNGENLNQNQNDFTYNLQGNVGEKVKALTTLQIRWYSQASEFSTINISSSSSTITANNGDFILDGWTVGDVASVTLVDTTQPTNTIFVGEITFVSSTVMFYNLISGSPSAGTYNFGSILGSNTLDAAIFKYNLVENSGNVDYISSINQEEQVYYGNQISSGFQTFQPLTNGTNITWQNGSLKLKNDGVNSAGYQVITISHEFIILPYYLTNYNQYYNSGTIPPDLNGTNSLKYVFEADMRPNLGNPNSSKVLTSSDLLGNVGWYNENFNGFSNNYLLTGWLTDKTNNVISSAGTTVCQAKIDCPNLQNGTPFSIGISRLIDQPNFIPNTIYENTFFYQTTNGIAGTPNAGNNLITNISSSISGSILQIDFDINYTSSQASLIQNGEYYIIWISVGQINLTNLQDDRVSLIASFDQYEDTSDVFGLVDIMQTESYPISVYNHNNFLTDPNADIFDSFNGMVEDGYLYEFYLSSWAKAGSYIQKLSFNIVAYNEETNDEFIIYPFDLDLSSSINVPIIGTNLTEQAITLNSTRGFNLSQNDQFNFANISTVGTVNEYTIYKLQIGFKINWEDWIQNPNINSIFYDNSKPNNNLNNKTSNYSVWQDYNIYPRLDLSVDNNDFVDNQGFNVDASNTQYRLYFPMSIARDYGNDNDPKTDLNPIHNCNITTSQSSTGNDLGGAILTNENTIIKARFSRVDGTIMDFTNYTGAIRLDQNLGGLFSIEELSTLVENVPLQNGLLQPLANETRTKIEIDPNNLFVDLICMTNSNNLTEGTSYDISARLWSSDVEPPQVGNKIMENNLQKLMEDGTLKYIE